MSDNIDRRVGQVQVIPFRMDEATKNLEVLLLLRNAKKGSFWQPVTGGRNPEETVREAAERELSEELGVTFDDCRQVLDDGYEFTFTDEHQGRVQTFTESVLAVILRNGVTVTRSDEHVEEKWLSPAEALSYLKYDTNKGSVSHYTEVIEREHADRD